MAEVFPKMRWRLRGCRDGRGVEKDEVEAARLFRLAAEQGDADAQYNLGVMYRDGRGVPKDEVEAARLYGLAAEVCPKMRWRLRGCTAWQQHKAKQVHSTTLA
eukprot:TRINITY_DN2472_c0_g1_i11.p4 TRINITY_DN2472_c0_g1~~TRINITY_DN2472_c0_g1_i11.p4  ORF type:complete len:103 (-),score=28.68 TRINITY_DN2472_c0_g1_i11:8-316(-)